jgi:hypothetical protein
MKKYTRPILTLAFCLIVSSVLVIAETTRNMAGQKISIFTHFNMEIFEDGKLSDCKMIVDLKIYDYSNEIYVIWDDVFIRPAHELKRVCLKAEHNSTQDGSIKDVRVSKDSFSFKIDFTGTFGGAGRTVQVVGKKEEGTNEYSIQAVGLWWSDILNSTIKTEWRSTDKKFVLPYKEVF